VFHETAIVSVASFPCARKPPTHHDAPVVFSKAVHLLRAFMRKTVRRGRKDTNTPEA
jgi:hypothetical protein